MIVIADDVIAETDDDNFRYLICVYTGPFFSTATYENFADFEMFPFSEEPIWILGVKYSLILGKQYFFIGAVLVYFS